MVRPGQGRERGERAGEAQAAQVRLAAAQEERGEWKAWALVDSEVWGSEWDLFIEFV